MAWLCKFKMVKTHSSYSDPCLSKENWLIAYLTNMQPRHILLTAGSFKKVTGKGGGVEYLILNFLFTWGHLKSNVWSKGDIICFWIYHTYFHHDVRSHGAGVTLPIRMRLDFFYDFPTDFSHFCSLHLSLLIFLYIVHLSHIFILTLLVHWDKQGFWKMTRSKSIFRTQFFKFFLGIWKLLVSSQYVLKTNTMSIQGHVTGTYIKKQV